MREYYLYNSVILYWVRKYVRLLKDFERNLKPGMKGRVHTDEVVLKKKGKKIYDISAVDGKTSYNPQFIYYSSSESID
ncbi:MAG TPA: hypothetical protein EYP23_02550 [Thermoplasmata archaeon]|nr:hypothetical protein [Thermoplasmata archaeon]